MSTYKTIGFIGLGVMGEAICRNLVKKSGKRVLAFDLSPEPLARLRADGAEIASSVADMTKQSDLLFLCLPSAKHVRALRPSRGRSTMAAIQNCCSIRLQRARPTALRCAITA